MERIVKKNTSASITYCNVASQSRGPVLEKSQDASGPWVPDKAEFTNYTNDTFALGLQYRLAVAWNLGQPILIEGETGIGKTAAVNKMAADLGWEVHSLYCHSGTKPEHLLGQYVPNTKTSKPPYVFAEGPVTRGLRQEEGRTKVILLEDLNFQMKRRGDVQSVLVSVMDSLNRNSTFNLAEYVPDQGMIEVSKDKTKLVALVCPPGGGYLNREPFDVKFVDHWMYQKLPSELPFEARKERMLGL
ncbi:MAG: AAA family ATPase [Candidatus Latescibacteria bacterium]|nr:AAA family ATPase [Candidatus Latescibacterota bacterium]